MRAHRCVPQVVQQVSIARDISPKCLGLGFVSHLVKTNVGRSAFRRESHAGVSVCRHSRLF